MQACPLERTKRSWSGHSGSRGSWFMIRVQSTWASGASAMAVPEWPESACLGRIHGDATDHIDAELHQPGVLHDRSGCLQRHGQTLTVPSGRPRGRHLLFTFMASRMQVPPNSDLTLGMTCVDKATPGRCIWRMRADERFANPAGIMQGGFLGAFADSSMGAAAVTYAEGRHVFCSNAEMKISFLGAVPPGADLTCIGRGGLRRAPRGLRGGQRHRPSSRARRRSGWWPGRRRPTSTRTATEAPSRPVFA